MPDMNTSVERGQQGTHIADGYHDLVATDGEQAELPDGYVSDAELLAWLETKSAKQYAELREQMNISNDRQELIQKLSDLKSQIEHAGTTEHVDAVGQTMRDLLSEYEGKPGYEELEKLFSSTLAVLDVELDAPVVEDMADAPANAAALGGLADRITSLVDKLGKVDSLALVQIQQLMADAKETSELASNVLSSREQTRSGIIGNIRG